MVTRNRFALAAAVALVVARSVVALDVDDVKWGFDGQVVEQRFNVLSVLVTNNTPNPFEGRAVSAGTTSGGLLPACATPSHSGAPGAGHPPPARQACSHSVSLGSRMGLRATSPYQAQ